MNRLTHSASGAVEIDRVAVLGVVLHPGAGAAPERSFRRVEEPHVARPRRLEVGHHPALRILRRQDAVVERALVVVGVRGGRIGLQQHARQPQHVVRAARLHRLGGAEMLRELGRREEVLVVAVTAGDEGAPFDHRLPEEARRAPVSLVARQLGDPLEADDLRDLRVGVQPVERVARVGQRREQRLVAEAARQREVRRIAGRARRRRRAPRSCRRARCAACAGAARRSSARSPPPSSPRASAGRRAPARCRRADAHRAGRRRSCASCTRARRRPAGPPRRSRAAPRRRGTRRRARSRGAS